MKSQKEIMKEVKKELEELEAWETLKKYISENNELNKEELLGFLIESMGSNSGKEAYEIVEKNKELIERHFTGRARVTTADEWEFKNILPEDHFISHYLDLATSLTDAYPEYHFSCALSLLSVAADRKVEIFVTPQTMYTNFWTLLLGYSTVSRKSTAIKIARTIMEYADMERKTLPEDFSPEALVEQLEENPQSYFLKDEFGDFLAKMNRSYQSGIDALLSRLYDCPSHYKRKLRKDTFEIEDAYLTFTGACVPKQIARHSSVEDIESGFFPRIMFIWPEREKERKDIRTPTQEETEKQYDLGKWLKGLKSAINEIYHKNEKEEIKFKLSDEALDYYNNWCSDFEKFIMNSDKGKEFSAFFGRMSDTVLKIAGLIELGSKDMRSLISSISGISSFSSFSKISRGGNLGSVLKELNQLRISKSSVKIAIYYAVKMFLPNAQKILKYVRAYQDEDQIQKVYELAVKNTNSKGKVTHSDLLRKSNMKAKDFKDYVQTLAQAGMLEIEVNENGKKNYIPLDPEPDSDFPDINAPSNIDLSVDIPDDLDVSKEEIMENDKNSTRNQGGANKGVNIGGLVSCVEDQDSGDGVDYSEVADELDIEIEKVENLAEKPLSDGTLYEPQPGKLKKL